MNHTMFWERQTAWRKWVSYMGFFSRIAIKIHVKVLKWKLFLKNKITHVWYGLTLPTHLSHWETELVLVIKSWRANSSLQKLCLSPILLDNQINLSENWGGTSQLSLWLSLGSGIAGVCVGCHLVPSILPGHLWAGWGHTLVLRVFWGVT